MLKRSRVLFAILLMVFAAPHAVLAQTQETPAIQTESLEQPLSGNEEIIDEDGADEEVAGSERPARPAPAR